MTQEELDLLTKDLCSRLRSRIWVKIGKFSDYTLVGYDSVKDTFTVELVDNHPLPNYITDIPAHHMKPYLRPMSSMTEEETKYKLSKFFKVINTNIEGIGYIPTLNSGSAIEYVNWLIENHFDYNGLIPMGLALEAKEGMYETNNE